MNATLVLAGLTLLATCAIATAVERDQLVRHAAIDTDRVQAITLAMPVNPQGAVRMTGRE